MPEKATSGDDSRSVGVVYLVGAGPGDPQLITVKGQRILATADCVVYDKLVDRRLLELAPAGAERIYGGKQRGEPSTAQDALNAILIDRARSGQRVVRLKGGDPLLFARGAEEAAALRAAGIPFEIVPGVTSALGAAASAGIPLTQRGLASAVAFVTGHEDPAKDERIDWSAIAAFPGTVVVYMALTRIAAIARHLMQLGKDPQTPVSLVEWCTSNRQQVADMTLARAAVGPPDSLSSPVLAVIGPVCRLREVLHWFEDRPLFGQRVLVLRPPGQARTLVEQLEFLGAQTIIQPAFVIEPPTDWSEVDAAIARLRDYDWLVFTSRNGVERFLERLKVVGNDLRALGGASLAAIGPGTAEALAGHHLRADLVPDEFRAEALAERLKGHVAGKSLLWPRADRGRELLVDELRRAGANVHAVVVYRQIDVLEPAPEVLQALRRHEIDWVLFSSSNMARAMLGWLDAELAGIVRERVGLISISPVTTAALRAAGYEPAAEAAVYTIDGLIAALLAARARSERKS